MIISGCMKHFQVLVGRSYSLCCNCTVATSINNIFSPVLVSPVKKDIGNSSSRSKENNHIMLKDWKTSLKMSGFKSLFVELIREKAERPACADCVHP